MNAQPRYATLIQARHEIKQPDGAMVGEIDDAVVKDALRFTPASSYDGTANIEVSPDDGATWFALDGYDTSVIETPLNTVASPAATKLYVFLVPADCLFRVRMSGGTQGTLTVKAKRAYFSR